MPKSLGDILADALPKPVRISKHIQRVKVIKRATNMDLKTCKLLADAIRAYNSIND